MTEQPELVCVRTCQGWDLAQIYRAKLEAMGIPVLLRYESAGLVLGITVDGLGEVRILVPAPFAAEAEALLRDDEGPYLDWDEPYADEEEPYSDEQNG